jgi:hypothetical protein
MTMKGLAALALAVVLCVNATSTADDAKLPDTKAFDKAVIDSLRAIHNKGADLYNTGKDYAAAYRLYQGALESMKPLLAHRPDAQKQIDGGLTAAEKEIDAARKAFILHETIENVRKHLKQANGFQKPDDTKTPDTKPEDKKPDDKKPDDKKGVAPMPMAKGGDSATVSGKVTLAGKPLVAGEVTIVSLNLAVPRTFTAEVVKGEFKFAEPIPPGKYTALITGANVPAKYHLVSTSGLMFEFASGPIQTDIVLK